MKGLLVFLTLLVSGVVTDSGPYPPSGWKPSGPAFELPARPQTQAPQQEYLPVDPRRPLPRNNFGDNVDVSVQGLPTVEQQPIFEVSPVNGQQFTGPSINTDIGRLEPNFQQAQYQQQLEKAREFARQRQYDAARASPSNGLPNQQVPRQFAYQTTTPKPSIRTPQEESTTEPLDLNEGENLEDESKYKKEKVTVEVTKQNIQEYPPELFLSPLSQFKVQAQFVPLQQFGQLRAPIIYQAAPESKGFDGPAHLSALPSVLAQRELLSQQAIIQSPGFSQTPIIVQQEPLAQEPLNQYQPITQYQPVQPQVQAYPQYQGQQVIIPPQSVEQIQPNQYQTQNLNQIQAGQSQTPQYFNQVQPNTYQTPQAINQIQAGQAQAPEYYNQVQPNQYQTPQAIDQIQAGQSQVPEYFNQIQPNQYKTAQPTNQIQAGQPQAPEYYNQIQPNPYQTPQSINQIQPNQYQPPQIPNQMQPNQYQTPQFLNQQPNQYQPQNQIPVTQYQPQQSDVEEIDPNQQPQIAYQNYQPQFYQQFPQPANQYQSPALIYNQAPQTLDLNQYYQNIQEQYAAPQYQKSSPQGRGQGALQSGLDLNQQGNGIEQDEGRDIETVDDEEGSKATAVATAFGTRTQPRVFAQYGAPATVPRVQGNPGYQTTEASAQDEPSTEDTPAVAEATAIATGRRNAKLRSRRIRPVFTLDRSGHLVLAQQ